MIVTREQHEAALTELAAEIPDARTGILGPGSVAWRLGGDLAVFLGGGRAALLQLAHPMVAFAVDQHSRTRTDVVGRFQRTFRAVFAMVFGELDDALSAARRVHSVHTRIHGTFPVAVGAWPAGTPYHANDADALRWVYASLLDTVVVVRERLDGPLPIALKDQFVIDQQRFARLFGIPRELIANSYAEHAAYMRDMFASTTLSVAPCAREMAAFLLGKGGAPQPPLGRLAEAVTAAMLPDRLASEFGLSRTRLGDAGTSAALSAFALAYRQIPRAWVALPARAEATRRLRGQPPRRFDAWMERQLFGLSRQVTGVRVG